MNDKLNVTNGCSINSSLLLKNFDNDPNVSIDEALSQLAGNGTFQMIHSLACIVLFGVGSSFFYAIPFYEKYPELECIK